MRAKTVFYEKLVNTGNFSHEKYGIEISLDDSDKASDAFKEAKKIIARQINPITEQERMIAEKDILYILNSFFG